MQDFIKNHLNPTKIPGYDLITGGVLKELPTEDIRLLSIPLMSYCHWVTTHPNWPSTNDTGFKASYRPYRC